ncbi:MAG TPA: FAD-binding oxidoreductase [Steroidobacteraceae bacterium]|nr:FAD-binding oxidoreductase [Steroidobacteraceae bacterium]
MSACRPIVVAGGGIGGLSAAYHLAQRGAPRVLLLERARLGGGTTGHSTGNMETYRPEALPFAMVSYAAEFYPRIAREAGRDIGWRAVGRVMYTDRAPRWHEFQTLPELGRARGIEIELLSPAELAQRLPILETQALLGGVWIPSDARLDPSDAVQALAHCARAAGVEIREQCAIEQIVLERGRVCAVETTQGSLPCEALVLAAGLWSAELARSVGIALPLYALEHQYLITHPCGVSRDLPLFLSYDDQLYGREEVGGILVGSLDDEAIPIAVEAVPEPGAGALLPERWPQFEPYLATALRRFPALRSAPVKMLLNGPEAFTPDGRMLLGPVPDNAGVWVIAGFNSNGMALAPAAGRYLAEWLLEGRPSIDWQALDVARFAPAEREERYVREQVRHVPGRACRLPTQPV